MTDRREPATQRAPTRWGPVRRVARQLWAPVERFLAIEAASGILLLVATVLAMAWVSSPWASSYAALWHTTLGVTLGSFRLERDLHFVVNDVLMAVFFFVVGLEIRREVHRGELSELRRAAVPITAALGGMIAPVVIYFALHHPLPAPRGWGVPMATDIAFAVGVLTLLGPRVPPALRILLLALAVVDDLGAIVVIALFYSPHFAISGLVIAAAGLASVLVLQRRGARSPWAYVVPAIIVWGGIDGAGIHPTLAGVIVGLVTPARVGSGPDSVSPVDRLIHAFHPWVAFVIMPLFALANAGVALSSTALEGPPLREAIAIGLGLALGKPLGIVLLPLSAAAVGLLRLPRGVGAKELLVAGTAGGIGFTMALFIGELAFDDAARMEAAKMAVLAASLVSALASLALGVLVLPAGPTPTGARTETEAESATET